MTSNSRALVIFSGGQDSTTCLGWALAHYNEVHALTFHYGQRHQTEVKSAERVLRYFEKKTGRTISHETLMLPVDTLKGMSPLTNPNEQLERYDSYEQMDAIIGDRVELTFVPMRNQLFITLAANRAAVTGCDVLVTGVCQEDNANYCDCREVFINSIEAATNLALGKAVPVTNKDLDPSSLYELAQLIMQDKVLAKRFNDSMTQLGLLDRNDILLPYETICAKELFGFGNGKGASLLIETPLMHLSKADTVALARSLPHTYEALAFSHTAYDGAYPPTNDHASVLRAHGFEQAGVPDPLLLRAAHEGLADLETLGPLYTGQEALALHEAMAADWGGAY